MLVPPTASLAVEGGLSIRMVSEVKSIRPGEPFYVGLFLQHDPGYHTYWKCPGIVGVPTQIDWKLPEGFEAGELEFPEPERVHMYAILAQGYERDVLLQAKITPPKDLKEGSKVRIAGQAWWMCCANECHPDSRELSVVLPVGRGGEPEWEGKWRPLFEKERGLYAVESAAWKATAIEKKDQITLTLSPVGDGARIPTEDETEKMIVFTLDGWFDSNKPQKIERLQDGGVKFTLTKAAVYLEESIPDRLRVVVQTPSGWLKDGYSRSLELAPLIERQAE